MKSQRQCLLPRLVEGYPLNVVERINAENEKEDTQMGPVTIDKAWPPEQTIWVAFFGGSNEAREEIAKTAMEWCTSASLKFSFQVDKVFREWKPSDTKYKAHIRIAFTENEGYWSALGTQSLRRECFGPGQASMNLEGLNLCPMPYNWRAIVLHVFGHALGFEHESNSFINPSEFRYHDDFGYTETKGKYGEFISDNKGKHPGLITYLGGPPNEWDREAILFNLDRLAFSYNKSKFDPASVMVYDLPKFFFQGEEKSDAIIRLENDKLSEKDICTMNTIYPTSRSEIESRLEYWKEFKPDWISHASDKDKLIIFGVKFKLAKAWFVVALRKTVHSDIRRLVMKYIKNTTVPY